MKPTHKVIIGNEVFMAECDLGVYKINGRQYLLEDFKGLNAKIEEIKPLVFEADVEWQHRWARVSSYNK
jgi:hypothetical protein